MDDEVTGSTPDPPWHLWSAVAAIVLCAMALYIVSAIGFALLDMALTEDGTVAVIAIAYFALAVVAPTVASVRKHRRRRNSYRAAAITGALMSLAVSIPFIFVVFLLAPRR